MPTGPDALPSLVIRADASPSIGMGHVMRGLAIAEAWRSEGGEVAFLGRFAGSRAPEAIERRGFRVEPVPAAHPDARDLSMLAERRPREGTQGWVVVDGYHFDAPYRTALQAHGYRVVALDDGEGENGEGADVLLNPNAHAERLPIAPSPTTVVLAGARFCLLRPEFTAAEGVAREAPARVRRVLVTMGGSDPLRLTPLVVGALQDSRFAGLEVVAAIGPDHGSAKAVAAAARPQLVPVRIVQDPENWPDLMRSSDLAIAAAGSTAWELAFCGVPAILVAAARNQEPIAAELARRGAAVSLGEGAHLTADRIASCVADLAGDAARLDALRQTGMALIDGGGARRVVTVMRALSGQRVDWRIRRVEAGDALGIWRVANDPAVRGRSFTHAPIPVDEHLRWFAERLAQDEPPFWVAEVGGFVAGQVRYSGGGAGPDEALEVHFSVAAPFRGRGLAADLLRETFVPACARMGATRVHGVAYLDNVASHRAFERADYRNVGTFERGGATCVAFERRCV